LFFKKKKKKKEKKKIVQAGLRKFRMVVPSTATQIVAAFLQGMLKDPRSAPDHNLSSFLFYFLLSSFLHSSYAN